MPYENKNPVVGTVNDCPVRRDDDGDYYLDINHEHEERFYITMSGMYTLEDCIAQLRTVCGDPKDRVIAAARAIADADYGEEDWDALNEALEALNGSAEE